MALLRCPELERCPVSRTAVTFLSAQRLAAAVPGHPRGTSLHSRSRFSQPPIQRPVQNRPSGTRSSNTPPANAGQQVNKGSQSSEEEKMKGRADVLNVTKNFLNPTTKPSVLTPSSASFTDTSLKVADAAGDTQLQVTTVPAAKTADIPSLAKAACDSSSSDATTLPSDTPPVAVGDMQ
ncbi:hypothetical protein EB796_009431 [Bugula neritina]|uniref:Uncharacterized protein n=1 Tax=Bugula neritina TaxID=10212 RepID=A0A7J7K0V8_BUGNE|nr:hypothetical protein EB796_009431 [Bugula neritina]